MKYVSTQTLSYAILRTFLVLFAFSFPEVIFAQEDLEEEVSAPEESAPEAKETEQDKKEQEIVLEGEKVPEAVTKTDGLPEIISHSQNNFAVYQGDKVKLSVEVKGQVFAKWVRSDEVICRSLYCEFDTASWSLGSHRIVVVLYNKLGSRTVVFHVRTLAAPSGYVVGSVTPPKKDASVEGEAVKSDDLTVEMLEGRGFSYDAKKVQVVGNVSRALVGNEKLKTQSGSWMRFGKTGSDEHFLGPNSNAQLTSAENGRRVIVLRSGRLRSRAIDATSDTKFSIVLEDGVQVDTDPLGDVIVERILQKDGEALIGIHVLRGNARILTKLEGSVTLHQGMSLSVSQSLIEKKHADHTRFRFDPLPHKVISFVVRSTTPQLFREFYDDYQKEHYATILKEKPTKLESEKVKAALLENDPIQALELSLPFLSKNGKDGELRFLVGQAYYQLSMHRLAFTYFKQALVMKYRNPTVYYHIAMIYVLQGKWNQARTQFEKAEREDYIDQQNLHYYAGVATYRLNRHAEAKRHFNYAVWQGRDEEIVLSSKEYLKELNNRGWFSAMAHIDLFYDSNIFRAADLANVGLTRTFDKKASLGLASGAGARVYGYRALSGEVSLGLGIERIDYLQSSFKDLGFISQTIDVNMVVNIENTVSEDALISFGLRPFLNLSGYGGERSLDTLGYEIQLGSPRYNRATLYFASLNSIDPLPGREDVLDPTLPEVVIANDRTNANVTVGLRGDIGSVEKVNFGADVRMQTVTYKHDYSLVDSYKLMSLKLPIDYYHSQRSFFLNYLSYTTRTFFESTDSRKDTILGLGVSWKYYWTPALHQSTGMTFDSQKSTREDYSFSRPFVTTGLRFDL